ncbi:MAG: MBL fold metallo-hydrolase [Oscillospiraceae bacterium]|nr:MBL fold metallo-hydrolase [Oscillospiraceae bacterium]
MNIKTLPLGDYQTNCYLVWADGSSCCAVIDPGYEASRVLSAVKKLGLTIDAVLLTHGHFDHVGAVEEIVEQTGCRLWMSRSDWSKPNSPMNNYLYPLANCDFCEVRFCEDQEEISAGGLTFTVLETPGHTAGSVCFLCDDAMFSGDTLFAGSCGRTDLGGDWDTIIRSLNRLKELEGDFRVFPGHGLATTLERERSYNPYMG